MTAADYRGRTRLLILQPTPFCNIDCGYCYLPDRNDRHRMSFDIVEAAVRLVFQHELAAQDFTVVWHGAEPLVLPVSWYRHAFAAASRGAPQGTVLAHAMQTNATLINDEWCDFFLENSIRVGVSIDGPARLHDARRRTRSGKATHARVVEGIQLLQRKNVPFHVICVIGQQTLDAADELADFFVSHGIRDVGFNIEEIEGANKTSSLQASGTRNRLDKFFARFFGLAQAANPPLVIREREELLGALRHPAFGLLSHNPQNEAFGFLSVSSRGAVFTFSPELAGLHNETYGDMSIGRLPEDDLNSLLAGEALRKMWTDIEVGIHTCRNTCEYFDLCLGGAPANKLAEHGSFAAAGTLHCHLYYQGVADAVLFDLEQLLSCQAPRAQLPQIRTAAHANCDGTAALD
ncbi:uncharacterized protein HNR60_002812 [Rhodopseudomonas rhenobacensis]|uniref:Radical SAM core domain-containing protein n=1 Tax=Rhodopseudomonas rhenobacensis TaxID=87461 RepID=A0A7W8E0M5_9BRAD|nr:uncharacterized protein [Rhodopseudomonas rhenobacensis]